MTFCDGGAAETKGHFSLNKHTDISIPTSQAAEEEDVGAGGVKVADRGQLQERNLENKNEKSGND